MKKGLILIVAWFSVLAIHASAQSDTSAVEKWLQKHCVSIQKTFDGSKDEKKPATLSFREDHLSKNDFFNIDAGVKIGEFAVGDAGRLIIFPKVEWHKSTDTSELKNKVDGGLNVEFYPFNIKLDNPNIPVNKGLRVAPWFQGGSSYKRNFIDDVNEYKLMAQVSLFSNYKWAPGAKLVDKNDNLRMRYYPYAGVEYNYLPDFIEEGENAEFSAFFVRLFFDIWLAPQALQLNIDGAYKWTFNASDGIPDMVPVLTTSLNFYPGKQDGFGFGASFKYGYETDSNFKLNQLTSIFLNVKI